VTRVYEDKNTMQFLKYIVVQILTWEARLLLLQKKPKIIAITGSVGKTTTKDAIFAVVTSAFHARKSEKSFNSEFGVPLTILGLDTAWGSAWGWLHNVCIGAYRALVPGAYPAYLVLEIGADHPGDISNVARWLKPDIAVITALPEIPVHVEYFDSPEAVVREKLSLFSYLKNGGAIVINSDDERLRTAVKKLAHVYSYGFEEGALVHAHDEGVRYEHGKPSGMHMRLDVLGSSVPVVMNGALGRPRLYAALAALTVAQILDIDWIQASQALQELPPTPGRMRLLPGVNGSTIIDDSYNSSPIAVASALETLYQLNASGRKVAILGDMRELGSYSAAAHRKAGELAANVDLLVTLGVESRVLAEAAKKAGLPEKRLRIYGYEESEQLGKDLAPHLKEGDIVLVKGSQNRIRLERAVRELMVEPEKAKELLVRQDEEWVKR